MAIKFNNLNRLIFSRSWTLSLAWQSLKYSRKARHRGLPVVVYQMGKVGSTSVYHALRGLPPHYSVYHVHTLQQARVRAEFSAYRATFHVRRLVPHHLLASRLLLQDLALAQPRGRWKVISIVRDPIERNISSFFQTIELYHPTFQFSQRFKQQCTSELVSDLLELFLANHDHLEPLYWLENEVEDVLGIDVFAKPFPTDLGYQTYGSTVADLVLFRLENLSKVWSTGISSLLKSPPPPLPEANIASNKAYGELYRRFKKELVLPQRYIDRIYKSRFAQHFYGSAELERRRISWSTDANWSCP